ncbi:MAG: hypothetical protein A2293_01795 [Elusimicrobia bacterium RIFOXYB2_FULL_49_7]|nr:MAG: hypothetical protein A2293_01795 [Elusimicrobia bacterium RIFOXYB2_FULL_49_7]
MNLRKITGFSLILVFLAILGGGWLFDHTRAEGDDFYESLLRLDDMFRKVKTHYVVDVPAESLVVYAVDGMRGILDPHTNYFEEKEYDNLMIQTKGEFGGLGINIGLTDNVLTVIAPLPIPNSPAMKVGLLSGDRILKINNETTKGMDLDIAVTKLRGPKGSKVTISILREGVPDVFDVELERDIIKINSVPYFGMLDEKAKIGYIKLVSFTQDTDKEMEVAIKALIKKGIASLVLDLRSNPGGLLNQAVRVSEFFLPPDRMIVYTKGRSEKSAAVFKSTRTPLLDPAIPLLVLVNQGSASASEIVSGAIQDHDRGVILGNETFGKGSVQTILPLERNKALKLTTAYYYTPSGRCINKVYNEVGVSRHEKERKLESELEKLRNEGKDTTKVSLPKEAFKTLGVGRTVYASGGISPDIDMQAERYSPLEIELLRKSLLFQFAVSEVAKMKTKGITLQEDKLTVTDNLYDQFIAFCKDKKLDYNTPEQTVFKEMKEALVRTRRNPRDTTHLLTGPNDAEIDQKLSELEKVMAKDKDYAFNRYKSIIQDQLTLSFLSVGIGQDAYYRHALKNDNYIAAAVDILKNRKRYDSILKKDFRKEGI